MTDIKALFREYRADLIKGAIGLVVFGMFLARLPSKQDIEGVEQSLVQILEQQRVEIEKVKIDITSRVTREQVKQMLASGENPWNTAAPVVMQLVNKYDDERKQTQEMLTSIRVDVGILREREKKK